eukprot:4581965-Pleurochrysis_carterae.AAC.1
MRHEWRLRVRLSRAGGDGGWRQAQRGCGVEPQWRANGAEAQAVGSARRDSGVKHKGNQCAPTRGARQRPMGRGNGAGRRRSGCPCR